ncbi:MAG: hypothetical protein Q9187_007267 [Circinaria calcarea]
MEGPSSDSTSTGQLPPVILQSTPFKRTGSGRPTNKRLAQQFAPSSSATALQQNLDVPDEDGETTPFPPSKEWQAIQCLKDCSDDDVLRWLDYARYPNRNPIAPQHPQQRHSLGSSTNTRSSGFSAASSRTSHTRRSLDSFHDDHQPPVPALQGHFSNDVEEYRHSKLKRLAAIQERPSLPSTRYFCTSCDKDFGRKGDWKSHEKEFHEGQEEYTCTTCDKKYHAKHRFIRHHKKHHGGVDCPHAETSRFIFPKKRAWGCGFCGESLSTFDNRIDHIAKHYDAGLKRSEWNHSSMILGLLKQPDVVVPWSLLLGRAGVSDWSTCSWSKETTNELQHELELEGLKTGDRLAMDAYNMMGTIATGTETILAPTSWTRRPDLAMMAAAPRPNLPGGFYPALNTSRNIDVTPLSLDCVPSAFSGYQPDQYMSGQGDPLQGDSGGAFTMADYQSPRTPIYGHSFYDEDD